MANWNTAKGGDEDVELILRKLFIGGIRPDTTDEQFKAYFAKFGEIEDFVLIKNKQTGQSKGFGFVTYSEQATVDECLGKKPHNINGKDVDVKRAVPKDQPQERCQKIFVGGLPETTESDLKEFFETYGPVTQCQFKRDQNTGRGRGFGFVSFESSDTVDKLIIMKHIDFNGKTIECKKALDVKDKQGGGMMNGGPHNPSVYAPQAGYPPPGYPAPPMPAYGAYPGYPGYGAPGAPQAAAAAPTAPGYAPPAAAYPAVPAYPGYPAAAPGYPAAAPGYPAPAAPAANPYYPQQAQAPGQYNQAPSSYGAQKNTYAQQNKHYKPY